MEDWGRGKGGPLACHLADRKEAFTIIGRGEGLGMPPGPRKTPAWKRTLLIKEKKNPTNSSFQRKTCGKVIFTSFWLWFCRVSPAGWACQATCEPPLSFSSVNAGGFTGKSAAWIFNGVNMGSGLEWSPENLPQNLTYWEHPSFLTQPPCPHPSYRRMHGRRGAHGESRSSVPSRVCPEKPREGLVLRRHRRLCSSSSPWRASSLREPLDAASN